MTHEAGLQAMKEYSESHGDESRDQQAPVRADSVSGIPPPVRADSVSGLPPPPLSQYDLPPPPLLDEIVGDVLVKMLRYLSVYPLRE